jgi:hypothetical protein
VNVVLSGTGEKVTSGCVDRYAIDLKLDVTGSDYCPTETKMHSEWVVIGDFVIGQRQSCQRS